MNAFPDPTLFMPMTRSMRIRIETTIEQLVALLDEFDGDADLESTNDDEPSLGWSYTYGGSPVFACDTDDDRELEDECKEDGADDEPDSDDEPTLGALNKLVDQGRWCIAGLGRAMIAKPTL